MDSSTKTTEKLSILVLGYIVRGPLGGMAWHHLQYVMGLYHLGHDVYFIEDSGDYPSCYDPSKHVTDTDPTYGLKFIDRTFKKIGLENRWAYYDAHTSQWCGPCADSVYEICKRGDILLNISGVNILRPWFLEIPIRVFIDTDPLFTQIRNLTDSTRQNESLLHNAFLSFGENISNSTSSIPCDGFPWQPTRQPIVMDLWPMINPPEHGKFTTVMQWDSYKHCEFNGIKYGMKSDSFEQFFELPEKTDCILELALGSETAPRQKLKHLGWDICDPLDISRTPWTYQHYIQQSMAEFSVAKHGYVVTNSGWFSERSAAYLASGRPVVVQETGFSNWLKTGEGIISFKTHEEALVAIEEINSHYKHHCSAARMIAEEYFNSQKVLTDLIDSALFASRQQEQ